MGVLVLRFAWRAAVGGFSAGWQKLQSWLARVWWEELRRFPDGAPSLHGFADSSLSTPDTRPIGGRVLDST